MLLSLGYVNVTVYKDKNGFDRCISCTLESVVSMSEKLFVSGDSYVSFLSVIYNTVSFTKKEYFRRQTRSFIIPCGC